MEWKKVGLISVAIALGFVGGLGSIYTTNTASAAATTESASYYNQFQQYVQKPTSLANARNYLMNHIK